MKEAIDETIEKLVFLLNAQEKNPGIYELTWEFGYHAGMDIGEKYSLAKRIVLDLVESNFVSIVLCAEDGQTETMGFEQIGSYLDNPSNWYPTTSPLPQMIISEDGKGFLEDGLHNRRDKINVRIFGKSGT